VPENRVARLVEAVRNTKYMGRSGVERCPLVSTKLGHPLQAQ